MREATVHIDSLAFGGSGVGRIDGKVCFVPFSCPGDELRVCITSEKRSFVTARIVDIIIPSQQRCEPPCPLFGSCGGCNWQHIAYPHQLAAKRQILADTLWRGARVSGDRIVDVVPSPQQYGYRSRVQLKLYNGANGLNIGFYRHGSHYVEDATAGCPVALPVINDAMQCLREVLRAFHEPDTIPQINIECGDQGVVATVNYIGQDPERVEAFFEGHVNSLGPLTGLFLQTGRKSTMRKLYGDGLLAYSLPGGPGGESPCTLTFRPGGFSQVNSAQNLAMLQQIRNLAGFCGHERLLDVYCGNGNLSLPLAGEVDHITGIEEYEGSIAAANDNCRRNGIVDVDFIVSDASGAVSRLADAGRRFDIVILDPPRTGAAETVRELHRLNPEKIIYISCDPSTLARDCAILTANGYSVTTSIPIDMFPQTYHLESITLLQRG